MNDGVIFDVDGVLVDSYDAHYRSWVAMAAEHDVEFTIDAFSRTFGRTSRDIIAELFPAQVTRNLDDARIAALDDCKEALFRKIISADFTAMDGAAELIAELHKAGLAIALGSSGPAENVNLVVDRLDCRSMLSAIITGSDVTRGKPDPEVFLLAAERLGLPPGRCVVIEDAPAGIDAAHAAGMCAVGLVSTGRKASELTAADRIVASLRELDAAGVRALTRR
jgi:beta-phosphoglucomutase